MVAVDTQLQWVALLGESRNTATMTKMAMFELLDHHIWGGKLWNYNNIVC
jgi:hypothetical protein